NGDVSTRSRGAGRACDLFLCRVRIVMRSFIYCLLASLILAGCNSGSAVEALQIAGPSRDTTSSIVRPGAPLPAAGRRGSVAAASALAEPEHLDAPALEQVAMITPRPAPVRPQAPATRKIYNQRFEDAKPIDFGKVTPRHYPVHGVDVSRWQGDIDWVRLRQH